MAATPPTGISGAVTPTSGYPQYGVQGVGGTGQVVTASNAAEKATYAGQGYFLWFTSKSAADSQISQDSGTNAAVSDPGSWLTGLGGMIGSGLEVGFVAGLTDLWNAIIGPVEIITGVCLAILVIILAFKGQLLSLAPLALALA
jgi:hypothetical protein